jgi:GTPase SAR1 family protein
MKEFIKTNNMRIIVLQGMPNTGKTSTLNLVYDMLVPNGGGVSTNRQIIGNPAQNDFSDIVIRGTQRIAFFTMGDYSKALADAINEYDRQGCDVLVCALSTNTPKVRANNALERYNTTRINKTIAPNAIAELATNTADAQTIFNLI